MPFHPETFLLRSDGPGYFVVAEPLLYIGARDRFLIPAGMRTDGNSRPRTVAALFDRWGAHSRSDLLHDYARRADYGPPVSTADADGLFLRVLREENTPPLRARLMWAAVRVSSGMAGAARGDYLRVAALAPAALMLVGPTAAITAVTLAAWRYGEQVAADQRLALGITVSRI